MGGSDAAGAVGGSAGVGGSGGAGEGAAWALQRVRAAWDEATREGAAACGLAVTAGAYGRMQRAWAAELAAQVALLERLEAGGEGVRRES